MEHARSTDGIHPIFLNHHRQLAPRLMPIIDPMGKEGRITGHAGKEEEANVLLKVLGSPSKRPFFCGGRGSNLCSEDFFGSCDSLFSWRVEPLFCHKTTRSERKQAESLNKSLLMAAMHGARQRMLPLLLCVSF